MVVAVVWVDCGVPGLLVQMVAAPLVVVWPVIFTEVEQEVEVDTVAEGLIVLDGI